MISFRIRRPRGLNNRKRPRRRVHVAVAAYALLLGTIILAASCATASVKPTAGAGGPPEPAPAAANAARTRPPAAVELVREEELFRSLELDNYARKNLSTFALTTLSNGVPVIVKENRDSQVFSLRVVLRGHSLFTRPRQAGIEAIALTMLTKGSRRHPYAEVQRILYEKSARLGPSFRSPDATSFDLSALSKYLPELFGLFADSFLHPRWDPDQFAAVVNDFKVKKQQDENDPDAVDALALAKLLFAGHPYYALPGGVDDSLSHIGLQDVVDYYGHAAVAERLLVVAVGDFDAQRLFAMLESTFGTLPRGDIVVGSPPPVVVRPGLTTVPFAESKGLAYVRGAFPLPHPSSPDYPALVLSLGMLDDILSDTVRTQHGAAYGVSAGAAGLAANYGTISVYKTSEPGRVKRYIDESIRILASGRCLAARIDASAAGKSGIGGAVEPREQHGNYVPVSDALQFYRDQYLSAFYAGQATARSVAAQIAASVIYRGDYRDYLLVANRLSRVTPDQIVAAVDRYLLDAPVLWVAAGPEELLSTIDSREYGGASADDYDRTAK